MSTNSESIISLSESEESNEEINNEIFPLFKNSNLNENDSDSDTEKKERIYFVKEIKNNDQNKTLNNKGNDIKEKKKEPYKFNIKRKRKRGKERQKKQKYMRIHSPYASDNLLRQINVHYLTFIVSFLNLILDKYNYKEKFLQLSYKFKKGINKASLKVLKKTTIDKIICNEISNRYREDSKYNERIYNKIKSNEEINKILSDNYLNVFKNFYLKNNRIINLKAYKIDKEISLSNNAKTFNDLLLKKGEEGINKKYILYLKKCIKKYFVNDIIFLVES